MDQQTEMQVHLKNISVQLATTSWERTGSFSLPHEEYYLCQRLSDDHSPLRIGNLISREAFPRVNSVGFLPPGYSVRLYPIEKPLRVINCVFKKDYFEELTDITIEHWEKHNESLVSIRNNRIEIMMQEIYSEIIEPDFGSEILIESASAMMLIELSRYVRQLDKKPAKVGTIISLAPWQLRRIQDRIAASLEIGYPSLNDLAEICGISKSYLMRTFKASTGWQLHKYITEEKLKTAKFLLAQDTYSCKEISAKLCFKNPAYFATAFRRRTGMSPSEFRKDALSRNPFPPENITGMPDD